MKSLYSDKIGVVIIDNIDIEILLNLIDSNNVKGLEHIFKRKINILSEGISDAINNISTSYEDTV